MTSQQQTPQECRTCLANGFPKQMIIFEQLPGLFWPNGKPKFKPVNVDSSKHEHKIVAVTTSATSSIPSAVAAEPTINMSESQRQSVFDNNSKEDFYKQREEKYDKNIEE